MRFFRSADGGHLSAGAGGWDTRCVSARSRRARRRFAVVALATAGLLSAPSVAQAVSYWYISPYHRDPAGNLVWLGLNDPNYIVGGRIFLISGAKLRASPSIAGWAAVPMEGGGYKLMNRFSDKCLDIMGPSDENGTPVHQWNCFNTRSQIWRVPIFRRGVVETRHIVNDYAGKCLDVPNWHVEDGQIIQIWSCNGANWNQEWVFHPAGG